MNHVSKWLFVGSCLALAFSCQPKKTPEASEQNSSEKECGYQSKGETTVFELTAQTEKPCDAEVPSMAQADALSSSVVNEEFSGAVAQEKEDVAPSAMAMEISSEEVAALGSENVVEAQPIENLD